ncbi:MAG: hypothetical protein AAFY76_12195, partial [Cyanobacteria bacterium J06649_11]
MQLHQRLFDEMLTNFDIQASDIAEVTGISEVSLSKFRRGKADLGTWDESRHEGQYSTLMSIGLAKFC